MKKCHNVAIIGSGAGWSRAPGGRLWERWSCNNLYCLDEQLDATRWFEMHPCSAVTLRRRPARHMESLRAMTIPVYSLTPDNPWHVRYPRVYPLAKAIRCGRDYFACTVAYQIALALVEGFTTIGLYGTPLTSAREALVERPCVEWWCGLASGRGVSVIIDHDSPIGLGRQQFRYGYEDQDERQAAEAFVIVHRAESASWLCDASLRVLDVRRPHA